MLFICKDKEPRAEEPRSKEKIQRTNPCRGKEEMQKIKIQRASDIQRPFGFFSLEFIWLFLLCISFAFLLWFLASWLLGSSTW